MSDYQCVDDEALASMEHHLAAFVDLADTHLSDAAIWLEVLDHELYRIHLEQEGRASPRDLKALHNTNQPPQ